MPIARKLKLKVQPELEPGHSDMEYPCPKCHAKHTPLHVVAVFLFVFCFFVSFLSSFEFLVLLLGSQSVLYYFYYGGKGLVLISHGQF